MDYSVSYNSRNVLLVTLSYSLPLADELWKHTLLCSMCRDVGLAIVC